MSKSKMMAQRKRRMQLEYADQLEFLRRVMEEDLDPLEGSAAEIRSHGDSALSDDLERVKSWQGAVTDADKEQVFVKARNLCIDELLRYYRNLMGYPNMTRLHREYMRVVHSQPQGGN